MEAVAFFLQNKISQMKYVALNCVNIFGELIWASFYSHALKAHGLLCKNHSLDNERLSQPRG